MLQCSFCNREVLEIELLEGRCPQCGSVLVWNEEGDDVAPPVATDFATNAAGDPLTTLDVSHDSVNDLPPQEFATPTPPPADLPSPNEADQKIRETMQPRKLSPDDKQILQTNWRATVDTALNSKMTLKSGGGEYDSAVMRAVPRRGLQNPGESADESSDYQLIDVIGEGGVGIVYAARQPSVDRTVAVKMLRPELAVEWGQRQKFLAEAVVTGDLDHPNIVPIHELGHRDDGALFYSMKRVAGTPWSDALINNNREENLDILMKVADAVAFAHSRGVVHRDLKPENVMLGDYGEVMVMDWGIAMPTAAFHRQDSLMQSGELGGTPAYMAPELATGPVDKIGPLADVYLLGGILYEIVTGLTPHTGRDVMHCVESAAANEIQPTQQSGELVNIALHAMATDPADRFATVQDFQAAIREYQSHTESIALSTRADEDLAQAAETDDYQDYARALYAFQESYALWDGNHRAAMGISAAKLAYARCAHGKGDYDLGISLLDKTDPAHTRVLDELRASQKERDARQLRLKRAKRTIAVTVAAFFAVICIAMWYVWEAKKDADDNRDIAEANRIKAGIQERRAKSQAKNVAKANKNLKSAINSVKKEKKRADTQAKRARQQRDKAIVAESQVKLANLRTEYNTYVSNISLIEEKIGDNAFENARKLLAEYAGAKNKGWEWARLNFLAHLAKAEYPRKAPVDAVAFSPNGRRYAIADQTGRVTVFDNPLRDGAKGMAWEWTHPESKSLRAVEFSPDNAIVATAGDDGIVRLWNAGTGKPHTVPTLTFTPVKNKSGRLNAVRFSYRAGNRWLIAGADDGSVLIWDIATGQAVHPPLRLHSRRVWDVDIDAAQSRIVSGGDDGRIIVWRIDHNARRVDPRKWIGTIGDDVQPREFADFHGESVYSVAFSPDGKRIVSSGANNLVRVWNPDTAKAVDLKSRVEGKRETTEFEFTLKGHTAPARCARFSPDAAGRLIVSGSDDNTVIIWDARTGTKLHTLTGHGGWIRSCAFAPSSIVEASDKSIDATILTGADDKSARLWRLSQSFGEIVFNQNGNEVLDVAVDPRNNRIAVARDDGVIQIYEVPGRGMRSNRGPRLVRRLEEGHEFLATTAVFFKRDPAGRRRFLTAAMDGTVRLWNSATGTQLAVLRNTGSTAAIALSPDERWIATAGENNDILLWDVASLSKPKPTSISLGKHESAVVSLAFSPDGSKLLSADSVGRCRVWDYRNRKLLRLLNGDAGRPEHGRRVIGLKVLPDNKRAITASTDETVKIWNINTGVLLKSFRMPDSIVAFALSPDGKLAAVAAATQGNRERKKDRAVLRLIDLADGSTSDQTLDRTMISSLRFRSDGKRLLAVKRYSRDGKTYEPVIQEWKIDGARMAANLREENRKDVWTAAYTPDGSQFLTVGGSNAGISKSLDGKQELVFGEHDEVSSVRFSPDGKFLASGAKDGWVKVWMMGNSSGNQRLSTRHTGPVVATRFLKQADGSLVLCTVGGNGIAFWRYDAAARMWISDKPPLVVAKAHDKKAPITAAAFSRDDATLGLVIENLHVELWNLKTGKRSHQFSTRTRVAHTGPVLCLALSRNAKWIVTGSEDNSAIVWEQPAGNGWQPIARMTGHSARVTAVDISADRQRILTSSGDRTAKLWDTRELAVGMKLDPKVETALFHSRARDDLKAIREFWQDSGRVNSFFKEAGARAKLEARWQRLIDSSPGGKAPPLPKSGDIDKDRRAVVSVVETLRKQIAGWEPEQVAEVEDTEVAKKARVAAHLKMWRGIAEQTQAIRRSIVGPQSVADILTLRRHQNPLTTSRFSPDGKRILTGSSDGLAILWPSLDAQPKAKE